MYLFLPKSPEVIRKSGKSDLWVNNMDHNDYMKKAIELAREASRHGEVPVGCVIVDGAGAIIGTGRNRREEKKSATAHAEIEAIESACAAKGDWRLEDCSMYVTLEPCPMCAGAIINARVGSLYYGAKEENSGSCGSVINLFMERYGYSPRVFGGVSEDECAGLLKEFFAKLRDKDL